MRLVAGVPRNPPVNRMFELPVEFQVDSELATAPEQWASERNGGNTELAGLRQACRRQAIVIAALTAALRTLRDGAMALRAENAELRAIEARYAPANAQHVKRGGRLRGRQGDADEARRATVRAVRSAISGPQRLPYTIQPAQDHERTAVAQPARRPPRGD